MWLCDIRQRIACLNSCQLTIKWMPKIKDVANLVPRSLVDEAEGEIGEIWQRKKICFS